MNDNIPETLSCISHETRSRWLLQRVANLRSNPNFVPATVEYAQDVVKLFEGHYMANKVMANVARQVICLSVLALHYSQSDGNNGATISCIQHITSALEVCSPNTTAATIDLLENIGLVMRVQGESDHRNHFIQPTERLISGSSNIVRIALSAADKLFPLRQYRQLMEGASDFMERYFASSLHTLLNITTLISDQRGSRLFATSDSGRILLCKLMSLKNSRPLIKDNTVSFPFEDIGILYGVSRTHIRRLMKKAETEGLVLLLEDGGRKIKVLPPLVDVFETMVAAHVARAQFDIHLANKDYDLLPIDRRA